MNKLIAASLVCLAGCGAIFNEKAVMTNPPPGATIDGQPGPQVLVQAHPHEVVYPDGRRCMIQPKIKGMYIVGDILTFPIGLIVDVVTDDWKVLDAGYCAGVMIQN
jgi:hypothetical protein